MTSPLQGYQDFQSYGQWRSAQLLAATFPTLPVGATSYGPFAMQNYAGVFLDFEPLAGFGAVSIDWYLDPATSIHVGADQWSVSSGTGLRVNVPGRGTFFVVTANNLAAAPGQWQTEVMLTNAVSDHFTYPLRRQSVLARLNSCPASGSLFFGYPFIFPGPTYLWFQDNGASTHLSLYGFVEDGAGNNKGSLFFYPAPQNTIQLNFSLPAEIFSLQVSNNDAGAAHAFDLTCITPEHE